MQTHFRIRSHHCCPSNTPLLWMFCICCCWGLPASAGGVTPLSPGAADWHLSARIQAPVSNSDGQVAPLGPSVEENKRCFCSFTRHRRLNDCSLPSLKNFFKSKSFILFISPLVGTSGSKRRSKRLLIEADKSNDRCQSRNQALFEGGRWFSVHQG